MPLPCPLLAAGAGPAPIVTGIAICFLAAALLTLICERLRLPSIAGFIVAGVVIGPIGLGLIAGAQIETIANLGLVLLLFLIGLELSPSGLLASGRTLIVTGLIQVPLTAAIATVVFLGLAVAGITLLEGTLPIIYLALACSFSSTLLVVKLLQERRQIDTVDGRLCIGLLIFQDIWAIVVLALQPNLEDPQVGPLLATFVGVALVIVVAWGLARFALPRAFRRVSKSPELVVLLALGWCFGLGLFAAGLGPWARALGFAAEPAVSMELGALIAGASMASFPYAHEIVAKVSNLRDFFITLFFVALGMSIPVPDELAVLLLTAVLVVAALLLRVLVFLPLLHLTGLDRRHALTTSTKLAQVSEFALVIAYLGLSLGHIPGALVGVVIFAFVLTAILTPYLFNLAKSLHRRVGPLLSKLGMHERERPRPEPSEPPRLVFLGFHRLASSLLHDLGRVDPELVRRALIVDFNVAIHERLRGCGATVVYGDVANPTTLRDAGVDKAEVIVSTITDDLLKGISTIELTRVLRELAPSARIVVNATRIADIRALYEAGADYVFSWRIEASTGVVPALLAALEGRIEQFLVERRGTCGDERERLEVLD